MPPKPPTHFLCLPLATTASIAQLTTSLARFAQDKAVIKSVASGTHPQSTSRSPSPPTQLSVPPPASFSDEEDNANPRQPKQPEAFLPPKAVRPAGTLHLTLGVMHLAGKARVDAAVEFLRSLDLARMLREAEAAARIEQVDEGGSEREGSAEAKATMQAPTVPDTRLTETKTSASGPDNRGLSSSDSSANTTDQSSVPPRPRTLATPDSAPQPKPEALVVKLQGLHSMTSPKKTSVLYAAPQDVSERLMPFCQQLRDEFFKAGFVQEEKYELKLHATVVNTIYASREGRRGEGRSQGKGKGRGGKRGGKLEFDVTELVERWKDKEWAEVKIESVAVCEMGAKADENGVVRYAEIGKVEMP